MAIKKNIPLGILAVTVAFITRLLLQPLLQEKAPFALFLPAVVIAVLYGGFRSGLLAVLLSTFASIYFIAPLRGSEIVAVITFVMAGLIVVYAGRKIHEAALDLEKEAKTYSERVDAITHIGNLWDISIKEIIEQTIEEAVKITDSKIGYVAFLNESETVLTMQGWSKSATKECQIVDKPLIYPVEKTGLWGEAVRLRKPVITNNYAKCPIKHGYPKGHVEITRHLNLPVFDKERIVAVVGVGNKNEPYTDVDVKTLTLLMERMWLTVSRKQQKISLENLASEKEISLQETVDELERSNEELSKFAYVASHDLKAPLRAVANLATWIAEDITTGKDVGQYVEKLTQRVKRMEELINGLLEYSRVGRLHTEKEWVDLNEIVARITDDLNCKGKIITCMLPPVMANKTRAYQVFYNLIGNALKHHDNPEKAAIKVYWQDAGKDIIFCIEDNGPGIEPQFHKKIFEIFQTLKPRDEVESTGIGLSIVKKIIEDNDGDIWVESELGKGAKFCFSFPK